MGNEKDESKLGADEDAFPGGFVIDVQSSISAAQRGDTESLGELIQSCRGYLLTMANRRLDTKLRVKLGASDVVQNTLLAAQKNVHQFRGESRQELLAWLKQILFHNISDARRTFYDADKRDLVKERNLDGDSRIGVNPIDPADDMATPGTHSVFKEHADLLKNAIKNLSDDYREVVRLRNWERLSFEEIGERMNRSPDAARQLWFRAVERLRSKMGGIDETD